MKLTKYLSLVLFLVMLIPACLIDDDDPVDPEDPRDKYLGTWKVNETCSRMNYSVQITADPGNSSQVLISNFGNPGPGYDPAVAIVTAGSITVTSQTIGEGWTVSGNGDYLSNGTIDWNYTLVIGPSVLDCSAAYTR